MLSAALLYCTLNSLPQALNEAWLAPLVGGVSLFLAVVPESRRQPPAQRREGPQRSTATARYLRYKVCFGVLNPDEGGIPAVAVAAPTPTPKEHPRQNAPRSLFRKAPVSVRSFFLA